MTYSADGQQAVADQHARSDQPVWLACLFQDGGTVAACGVPCQLDEKSK